MVYLAELLVVMTDGLKIVGTRARNVHHIHRHKHLDNIVSRVSRSRKATVLCCRCAEASSRWNTKKLILGQALHIWQWSLSKKVVATVLVIGDTKPEQSNCNKSSVR